jgi:ribonuclease J
MHASGHGYEEEIKLMLNLTKPRYVMPFHGDYKRLRLHGQLAEAVGDRPRGDLPRRERRRARARRARRPLRQAEGAGMIFVDGVDIGDAADAALRDRRMLSADGIFIVVATISEQDGGSVAEPEVIFRGVAFMDEAGQLVDEIKDTVEDSLERAAKEGVRDVEHLQQLLHDHLGALVYERLRGGPWCFRSSSKSRRTTILAGAPACAFRATGCGSAWGGWPAGFDALRRG